MKIKVSCLIFNPIFVLLLPIFLITSCGHNKAEKDIDKNVVVSDSVNTGQLASNIAEHLSDNISSIFQDSKNNYWFGTDGLGVYRFDGKDLLLYDQNDGLVNNQIFSIQEDDAGNIWFNTPLGVSKFDGMKFVSFLDINSSQVKTSAGYNLNLSQKDLWFGAGGGAYFFDGKKMNYTFLPVKEETNNLSGMVLAVRPFAQSAKSNTVYCTYKDKKGNIWFGTQTEGAIRFDGKEFIWLSDDGLSGPAVRAIFEDSKGNLWFGNNGSGVFKYDGTKLTNMTKSFHLENELFVLSSVSKPGTMARVWAIEEDDKGDIWIGTIDCGLWRFDGKKFVNYTMKDGLTSDFIQTIYRCKNGKLWFGTSGGGVCTFDGSTFKKLIL